MKKWVSVLAAIVLAVLSIFLGIRLERLRWEKKSASDQARMEKTKQSIEAKVERTTYMFIFGKTMTSIHMQAQLSVFMCSMISDTWGSVKGGIFANERDKVTKLTSGLESRGFYRTLESNNNQISEDLRKLQSPPSEFKEAYDLLLDMNGYGAQLYNMAKSPGGTFEAYSNNVGSKYSELVKTYNKISYFLPRQ